MVKIDHDKEKHLQGAKTEIEDKVKRILKLIKEDKLDEDGTQAEVLKREQLAELIEDVHEQYICYHDHLEGQNLGLRNQISELEMKSIEREEELSAIRKKLEDNENESSSKISDLTSQMNNLQGDIDLLHAQKNELEELINELEELIIVNSNEASTRVESNTNEVNVLQQEVESLQHQKSDLEVKLVEKSRDNSECTVQIQSLKEEVDRKTMEQERLMEDKENLTMQIRNLELGMDTIKRKNSEDEEQIKAKIQEISHLTQQKLELHDRIAELEKRSAERESELSVLQDDLNKAEAKHLVQISACREQIKIHNHDQLSMYNQMQKLELENIGLYDDIAKLAQEKLELADKIDHSERRLATREFEFSALQDNFYKAEEEASGKIIAFTGQVDNLQKDLLSLQKAKQELELCCEKIREKHAQALTMVDNEKNELANKYIYLRRILEERDEEYKHVDSWYNNCKAKLKLAERKMEEMAEMFHEGIDSKDKMVADLEHQVEDLKRDLEEKGDEISALLENVRNLEVKLRLSNQKEESFRKAEEKFQRDQRALEDRITTAEATTTADNEVFHETITSVEECVNSTISGIDTISSKFLDDCNDYENRISNISHELQAAKESVSKMNREKEQLQTDKNHLLEEESTLRETVEKLEAKARKEESEKMKVTTTVVELMKTVEELKKLMKEKEEDMLDLGEEKREAIRQLCLWIDYHREHNDYLKEMISKTGRGQRGA